MSNARGSCFVDIDDLASAIAEDLAKYSQEVTDGIKKEIKKVARECKQEIQDKSPVLMGDYKDGWRIKIAFESKEDIRVVVHNKTDYRLTHLLENGHAKATGGRVDGKPHIGPAEKNAEKKLIEKVKVVVRG